MHLTTFDLHIHPTILARGKKYYTDRLVSTLEEVADHEFIATVEGSDSYEVQITLDETDRVLHQQCDCPYAHGPVCKHTVAALFELRDERQGYIAADQLPDRDLGELDRQLRGRDAEQLREMLLHIAERGPEWRELVFWLLSSLGNTSDRNAKN